MMATTNFLLIFDSGVLRDNRILDPIGDFVEEHHVIDMPMHITDIGMIEWIGFNWVQFLIANEAQSQVEKTWKTLQSLSVLVESEREEGGRTLRCYFESFRTTSLLTAFSNKLLNAYIEQEQYSSSFPSQQHVAQLIKEEFFDGITVREERIIRAITILAAQILFAPSTIGLSGNFTPNRRAKEWSDFFVSNCIENRINYRSNELAYLWPTYGVGMQLAKGQALDLEIFDMLFFGGDYCGHKLPIHVFTKEVQSKMEERLKKACKTLLGVGSGFARDYGMNPKLNLGRVSCLKHDTGKWGEIYISNIFHEVASSTLYVGC